MPKVSPIQSNFGAGEFSPLMYGRVDADRYKTGLATCLNYVPTVQGGLTRRPGSKYVSKVKTSSLSTRLHSFEFSTTQAYILEFGNQYIRFYKDNGQITEAAKNITGATAANPVVITSNSHGYSNGDRVYISGVGGMVQINNLEFTVANVAANTFELSGINGSAYTAYTSGGTVAKIYEIASTYVTADLFQLKFVQSGDVLYITHPSYAPRKLTRTAHTSWSLSVISFLDGPYLPIASSGTIQPSSTSGSVTLTASGVTFSATDVGRVVRLKHSSTWGYARITSYTDSAHVDATVVNPFGATTAASTYRLGLWSDTTGYPATAVFHEDRLFFAGSTIATQRLDGSNSGDYENFAPTDTSGTTTASNAVSFSLNANDVNVIRWMSSDEKGLLVGTVGGEWAVRPSAQSEALSPTNITAKRATSYGSANIQPVQVGKSTIYAQRAERKIRELTYFFDVDGFRATDLTIISEHITAPGLVQVAYQKEPQSIVWSVRDDGALIGMTYDRDLDSLKVGWHRHIIGGVSDAASNSAIVESVAVIPSADGTRDELWMIVKRRVNGATVRYVEYMTKLFEDTDEQQDAFFLDAGLTYDSPLTITAATAANPVVVTSNSHGLSNGDVITIRDVEGMTELNGETFTVANVAANTFELSGVNGSAYSSYVSGGEARKYVTTIYGFNHLIGQSVSILADGAVQPSVTVASNGSITLSNRAATVQAGITYNSDGQMLRLEAGAADGTALGKTRRTHRMGMLLHRTLGLKIGMDFDSLNNVIFRTGSDLMTRAPDLFSGITSESLEADYDFENQFCWRQSQPLPGTLLALMPQMVTQDR